MKEHTDNNNINTFLSLKNLFAFLLAKGKIWKQILTLIVNYCKIVEKNKLYHPKQQQISYLMIYDVTYSLLVLTGMLAFFNKHL